MPSPPSTPGPAVGDNSAALAREDAGYHHDLNNRQMQMIAIGEELAAEELRRAALCLGRLLGRVDVEDILDVIFREFCIGK